MHATASPDAATLLEQPFGTLPELIAAHARAHPERIALADAETSLSYAELDRLMDRIAAGLQRDRAAPHRAVSIVAAASVAYLAVFLGALRSGNVPAPIAPSATPAQIAAMVTDSGAAHLFLDAAAGAALTNADIAARRITLDDSNAGEAFTAWLPPEDARPSPVTTAPDDPFNIIYSSGTTGTPKGIVQPAKMRWSQFARARADAAQGPAVTLTATPLYSNTTLVSVLPTLAHGGTVVLMAKFDAREYLRLAERHRATDTMLVPVQYQRIMALDDFDRFDLSSFRRKACTSAPFSAELKADIVARWPGELIEYYGMTEGGASCGLLATSHPDKLHTVGKPLPGHEMKLIDAEGREVAPGGTGEVVGRSPAMMIGYHNRADATRDAEWIDPEGNRWIRHGDLARFDEDGFLILMGRAKDLIISGGFNIYPADLEAVLAEHPAVADCAVVGVPSERWGETPVGFYVPHTGIDASAADVLAETNARLGKTQRLAALHPIAELPRSAIGKVLKRELRVMAEAQA